MLCTKVLFNKLINIYIMKRKISTVFYMGLVLLLITTINSAKAQWLQSAGPFGGNVRNFVFNSSNDAFIATNGGIFSKLNSSANWTAVNSGLTTIDIRALAVSGANLFAGGYEVAGSPGGVFFSTDKGANWTVRNTGLTNRSIISLGVNGTNVFAGTNGAGVYFSSNNGLNWTQVNNGLSGLSLTINTFYSSGTTLYAGTQEGFAITTNNGTTWNLITNGLTTVSSKRVGTITIKGSNIFVGTGDGVFVSTNNGTSFSSAQGNLPLFSINSIANDGSNLITSVQSGGVYKSSNDGVNWTAFNTGLTNLNANSLTVIPNYIYVSTQGDGVFYSFNNSNWVNSISGLYNTTPRTFMINGANIFTGTFLKGIAFTSNSGANWIYSNSGLSSTIINDLYNDGTNFYAATSFGVFKSVNNGNTWTNIGSTFGSTSYIQSFLKIGSTLYAGSLGAGIFTSTNEGANWTAFNSGLSNLQIWDLLTDGTNIYAAAELGGVFKVPVSGSTWSQSINGITGSTDMRSLYVSGNTLFTGYAGIYKSTDGAATWTSITNDGLSGKTVRGLYSYDNGNIIFAGTAYNGFYVSSNGGANFISANLGLPAISEVNAITVFNNDVYLGLTGFGVWKRPVSEIISAIINISSETPTGYTLGQNYPNPFNPETNIKFSVQKAGNVTLKVYDITGKVVSTLVNGYLRPGIFEVQFNANSFSSGIYVYKLTVNDYTSIKKMTLVK
jgi:hypothetical protein